MPAAKTPAPVPAKAGAAKSAPAKAVLKPAAKAAPAVAGAPEEKRGNPAKMWTAALDGSSLTRTIVFPAAAEAGKAGRRVLNLAEANGHRVEVCLDGAALTVRLPATAGKAGDKERIIIKRLADPSGEPKPAGKSA
jgi:hypothetical protein